MTFYRNHYRIDNGCSAGFAWFTSRTEAVAAHQDRVNSLGQEECAEDVVAEEISIAGYKKGLVADLNMYASHPDNG